MASLNDQLEALAECLCAEVGGDSLCFCGVVIGDKVYDFMGVGGDCEDDECGQAWIRVTNSYMASTLGEQDTDSRNCGLELNVELEIGVLRCFPIPAAGEAVEAAHMLAASRKQNEDMLAMRRAVVCCEAIDSNDFILGVYTPQIDGNLYGGTWTAVLGGF